MRPMRKPAPTGITKGPEWGEIYRSKKPRRVTKKGQKRGFGSDFGRFRSVTAIASGIWSRPRTRRGRGGAPRSLPGSGGVDLVEGAPKNAGKRPKTAIWWGLRFSDRGLRSSTRVCRDSYFKPRGACWNRTIFRYTTRWVALRPQIEHTQVPHCFRSKRGVFRKTPCVLCDILAPVNRESTRLRGWHFQTANSYPKCFAICSVD